MYNNELKTRFIRDYTANIGVANQCVGVFNAVESYENDWDADLCTRSAEDLSPIVGEIVSLRMKNRFTRINILKDYVKWCLENEVSGACDGMLKIESIGLEKVKKQTVSSPFHLQIYLDAIMGEHSLETVDVTFRCYCWLSYLGFSEEEIFHITAENVDFENMLVRYNNKEAPIYREALQTFRKCVSLTEFRYDHPGYGNIVYKDRAPGELLIRGLSTPQKYSMRSGLSARVKKAIDNGFTEQQMSLYRIWISGVFYRAYERERAGFTPTFEEEAFEFTKNKQYKLDSGRNKLDAKKRRVAKEYLEDYQRWKLAFAI